MKSKLSQLFFLLYKIRKRESCLELYLTFGSKCSVLWYSLSTLFIALLLAQGKHHVWHMKLHFCPTLLCQWHTHRAYVQENSLFYILYLIPPSREILLFLGLMCAKKHAVVHQLSFNRLAEEGAPIWFCTDKVGRQPSLLCVLGHLVDFTKQHHIYRFSESSSLSICH